MICLGILVVLCEFGTIRLAGTGGMLLMSGAINLYYYKNSTLAAYRRLVIMNLMVCFIGLFITIGGTGRVISILLIAISVLMVCLLLKKKKINK